MEEIVKLKKDWKLSELSKIIACSIVGPDITISALNFSNRDSEQECVLAFATSQSIIEKASLNLNVKAIITSPAIYHALIPDIQNRFSFIISDNPEPSFYHLFIHLVENNYYRQCDWKTELNNAVLQESVVIEDGVVIGNNVEIGAFSIVKRGTMLGDNVKIGSCCVIGGDGFQLIKDENGNNMLIPHIGRLKIGNNVSICDNVSINRSLFSGYTEIGDYVKIDSHVYVAHNCRVGNNSVITANCTIFGSATIRDNVWIAPNSAIMNKVVVGSNAFVCAATFVMEDVTPGDKVFGVPALPMKEYKKQKAIASMRDGK